VPTPEAECTVSKLGKAASAIRGIDFKKLGNLFSPADSRRLINFQHINEVHAGAKLVLLSFAFAIDSVV
jgi:hypothetical protein